MMKTFIRRLSGIIFYYCGLVRLKLWLEKKDYALILFGHKVTHDNIGFFSGVLPSDLERVVKYLSKQFKFVTMDELAERLNGSEKLKKRYLALTFDDGFRDNYLYAFPILKKYKVPATIYLVSDCIELDRLPWAQRLGFVFQNTKLNFLEWEFRDFRISEPMQDLMRREKVFFMVKQVLGRQSSSEREKAINNLEKICKVKPANNQMMTWQQVKEMKSEGICFGAHTMTHPILKNLPLVEAVEEISFSRLKIEEKLNSKVHHFAFPAGSYSDELLSEVAKQGFKTCFIRSEGFDFKLYPGANSERLIRLGIANEPHYVILSEVAGLYSFFRQFIKT